MAPSAALVAAVAVLALACLLSALATLRLLVPNRQQRARLRAERIERLFREEGSSETAGAV